MDNAEIKSFQTLWEGGYFEGDPLNPHATSGYSDFDRQNGYLSQSEAAQQKNIAAHEIGFMSVLHVAYLMCIRNKVRGKAVLEIGPGRGAWSRCLLREGASHLYALDALSAEHNGFFEYISSEENARERVDYQQVSDMSCAGVPDGSIDFFFSFGCFCHLSRSSTTAYFDAIFTKMKPGAEGYIMISDYKKVAAAFNNPHDYPTDDDGFVEDVTPAPGRWYHLGTDWFCKMITQAGFVVLDRDIGCNLRDPVVHFQRP